MINPQNSPLCGMCSKVVDCPCECHIKDIASGFHEDIHSVPIDYKVRNEGKGPTRLDYVMMKQGKLKKTWDYRLKRLIRVI